MRGCWKGSRESPIRSLFTYVVAQTHGDLGRDKGEIRLFWKLW